jgi:predicted peptidase
MQNIFAALAALALATAFTGCTTVTRPETEASPPAMQTPQHFQKQITRNVKLDYLLFLPEGYSARGTNRWPLMLFLHGAGERGTNLQKVAVHGPPKLVKAQKDFPFILVSPQCPEGEAWQDDSLLALLDDITRRLRVDASRVYVTGLSMGGYGSWSLGTRHPERFAAIAPICGGGEQIPVLLADKEKKAALRAMGVWAFHGGKDVKLTVYPEAGHDSWTQAYGDPEIWNWFLAHRRR